MALAKLNQLYRSVVLDHASHPRNFGELTDRTADLVLRNPSCGDIINVQVRINANVVEDVKFMGEGCTISKASASMMTTAVKGKSIAECNQIIQLFSDNIINKQIAPADEERLGDALLLSTVAKFPTRIRCATLGWHALDELINDKGVEQHD
ncbi:SUF system NifU family Fe-S cluster assembly protein [Nicoliella spurrieriana]|uniref:SUF system NifU family Fe-S cluster assembly protein n=1 Tax=Nicoliella spurrieriana TaxID=2925830 RepID=A0A976RSX9_9LACO|nr:SUF system NifU family Fe-S cluster assembly protein [Nicoliella spurrieriana]UQS87320.1 SUF system NifU family Fe-S cluster assembly protein [Nicoliella spurrieriana]